MKKLLAIHLAFAAMGSSAINFRTHNNYDMFSHSKIGSNSRHKARMKCKRSKKRK